MDNIRFIKPADLHAEMLRLYREEQMDFPPMEMHRMLHADWVLSTCWNPPLPVNKQQYVLLLWTARILNYPVSATFGKQRISMNVKYMTSMVLSS